MARSIVLIGGSGLVGSILSRHFRSCGDQVVVLGRTTTPPVTDDPTDKWTQALDGADAVVNLCGAPVARKHSPSYREELLASRVGPTQSLGLALIEARNRPEVWLNASAVGFYGDRGDEELTEDSSKGSGFLPDLCAQWEESCLGSAAKVRKVALRLGVVLSRRGGALPELAKLPFGAIGKGTQYLPWIHEADVAGLVEWLITHDLAGPINAVAPGPVTNGEFFVALGKKRLPRIRGRVFRAVSDMMGLEASVALEGQRVLPKRALDSGYQFAFPELGEALHDLLSPSP
jgi:uncharacterized protein (TIGR01777 family)